MISFRPSIHERRGRLNARRGFDPVLDGGGGGGSSTWDQYANAKFLLNFDGNVDDESASPLTWTPYGSPTYPSGKFSQSISVNGSTQYVEAPSTTFPSIGTLDSLSFGFWVKPTGVTGDQCICEFGHFNGATYKGILCRLSGTSMQIFIGGGNLLTLSNFAQAGVWTHFLFVKRGGLIDMYKDGRKEIDGIFGQYATDFRQENIRIGRANHNNADWFTGEIDSFVCMPNFEMEADGFRVPQVPYAESSTELNDAPRYANTYGKGDRSSDGITITSDLTIGAGTIDKLLDGSFANDFYFNSQAVAGKHITVQFPTAVVVDRIRFQANGNNSFGSWQPQVSNNGSDWTNVDSVQALTSIGYVDFALNDTAYTYYRILGDSGSIASINNHEWEFRIKEVS